MSDPNEPDRTAKPSAFKRGDVAIFIGLPLLLAAGFGAFYWWRQHSADPNLRLIAQVTDEIAVELVAVAQYTGQSTPYTKWWKANGLPAEGIVEDDLNVSMGTDLSQQRLFLLAVSDKRLAVSPAVSGRILCGHSVFTSPINDGNTVRVIAQIAPTPLSGTAFGIKVASLGRQSVGTLSPEKTMLESTVHGQHALIEIGKAVDIVSANRLKPGFKWAVRITETIPAEKSSSPWVINARDNAGRRVEHDRIYHRSPGPICDYWLLKSDDWATVTVERTVYDMEVRFDGVAAHAGSITSPTVSYIGEATSK